jgi:hypothetical protein
MKSGGSTLWMFLPPRNDGGNFVLNVLIVPVGLGSGLGLTVGIYKGESFISAATEGSN